MNYKNRDFIGAQGLFGIRIREALDDIAAKSAQGFQQVVVTPGGVTDPPPQISGVTVQVTKTAGLFDVAIQDNTPVSRGINYFAEWSLTANFSKPVVIDMGASRNLSIFLGGQTVYWRAYSSYPTSAPSAPVYFGTAASPTAVVGTVVGSATPLASTGSGTSPSSGTQGNSGFGQNPARGRFDVL